ncbi:hypothetical protein TcasGA2_TC034388 [Tribolium castaneum]|uniref:Single domain-containing protein n=1 Tax=Tribolium castaneum TaxID=7070 RepID=A0A139WBJ7_TRICA|nr:hypothetical protein TcasGA2_TC034388 [Tribolium castaneum]
MKAFLVVMFTLFALHDVHCRATVSLTTDREKATTNRCFDPKFGDVAEGSVETPGLCMHLRCREDGFLFLYGCNTAYREVKNCKPKPITLKDSFPWCCPVYCLNE